MKKSILIAAVSALFLLAPGRSSAQIYVKVRPAEPTVVERPVAPSPNHVWVENEWRYDKHRHEYAAVPGHWTRPRKGYHHWTAGRWEDGPRGSRWIAGHWER